MFIHKIFSHPDFTVGFGIAPNHARRLADFYRQLGNHTHPEDLFCI